MTGIVYFDLCFMVCLIATVVTGSDKPNIVLIMADDLGTGDLGCYGNDTIKTPNIDQLAKEGVKMTQFLAAAPVCTPSRAAFMTGRYPVRLGLTGNFYLPVNIFLASRSALQPVEITFAELAKGSGYRTALIGKWHLGLHHGETKDFGTSPNGQGFDYYYGVPLTNLREFDKRLKHSARLTDPYFDIKIISVLIGSFVFCFSMLHFNFLDKYKTFLLAVILVSLPLYIYCTVINFRILNGVLFRNDNVVEQPLRLHENMTKRLVKEGVEFIEKQHQQKQPFLLFMSWLQVHTALHTAKEFEGHSVHGEYGDNVEEMDWGVGEIIKALVRLGIKNNTFVFFTSDHGAHVEEYEGNVKHGGVNGIFRGGKFQGGMEGGIRVPGIAVWPSRIPAGVQTDEPVSNMDIFSTIADIVNQREPQDRIIDGKNIMPLLSGDQPTSPREFLIHYCTHHIHAARWRPPKGKTVWKLRYATPNWLPGTEGCRFMCKCEGKDVTWNEPPLLFDITNDQSEQKPLDTKLEKYNQIMETIKRAVMKHKETLHVTPIERQDTLWKMFWRPWLQPCCNFPYCNCRDTKHLT